MPDHEYGATDYKDEDDKKLEALGYVPSFKREFSNLATVCAHHPTFFSPCFLWAPSSQISFAFSIMVRTPSRRT
jgi:hypothetical protein